MKRISGRMSFTCGLALASTMGLAAVTAAWPGVSSPLEVQGSASFVAATNVPGINVHGESKAVNARVSVIERAEGLTLERVEATLPVSTLATGMSLRDEHMRKLVFTSPDGGMPDVTFVSRDAACSTIRSNRQATCAVAGELAIRGIVRPFTMTLNVNRDGAAFRATGDGIVKLSAYGIDQPSQFGVHTLDEVKLHLDVTARPTAAAMASAATR